MRLFGLGVAEWVTIIALVASIPLTLKIMARASAAYERKAAERAGAAGGTGADGTDLRPSQQGEGKEPT